MPDTLAAGHAAAAMAAAAAGPSWADQAMDFLLGFKAKEPKFLTEDLRRAAELAGIPKPPDRRAWGHVVVRARAAGIIAPAGYAMTTDPNYNASPKTVWRFC